MDKRLSYESLIIGLIVLFSPFQGLAQNGCKDVFQPLPKSECHGACLGDQPNMPHQDFNSQLQEFNDRSDVAKVYLLSVDTQVSGGRYTLFDRASRTIFESTNLAAVQAFIIIDSSNLNRNPWIFIQGSNSQRLAAARASIIASWPTNGSTPRIIESAGRGDGQPLTVHTIPKYLMVETRIKSVSEARAITSGPRNGWHGFVVNFGGFVLRVYARTAELAAQLRTYFVGVETSNQVLAIDLVTKAVSELRRNNPDLSEADVRVEFQDQVGSSFVADVKATKDEKIG